MPNHYCGADFRGDQPKIESKNWRKRENNRCLENGKHIKRTSVSWLVARYQQDRSRRPQKQG